MARHIEELIERQVKRWNSIVHTLRYAPGDPAAGEPGLRHPVICMSRRLGSGARSINAILCERLGYQVFGSALIDEIARDLNVQRQLVNGLDERARGEIETLLDFYLEGKEISPQDYFRSLVRVVEALTRLGGTILLGRGSSLILGERAGLRVFVTAPLELRVRRLMQYESLDEATAQRKIAESDRERDAFVRKYWKVDVNDPLHYDMVINSARLDPGTAAGLILHALEARGFPAEQIALRHVAESGPR